MKKVCFLIVLLAQFEASAKWEVPTDPNPERILVEARADVRARKYEDALAKYLWFHNHALEFAPSLKGVRLGPALASWHELGKTYPLALEKLKETRDDAAKRVLERAADMREAFRDLSAINAILGEDKQTAAVFVQLDKDAPDKAKTVYQTAQPSLVKSKEYRICGKYLEPKKMYPIILQRRQWLIEYSDKEKSSANKRAMQDSAEQRFLEDAATLIALLVLNDRKAEGEDLAKRVTKDSMAATRDEVVSAALRGKLPQDRR